MLCFLLSFCRGADCSDPQTFHAIGYKKGTADDRISDSSHDCYFVTDCTFEECVLTGYSDWSGGAIKLNNANAKVDIMRCTFDRCSAQSSLSTNWGGAIYLEAGHSTMEDCCGNKCWAKTCGHFLYVEGGAPTIQRVTMQNSPTTTAPLGTLYILNAGAVNGFNLNLTGNTAESGSAVYVNTLDTVNLHYLTVTRNGGSTLCVTQNGGDILYYVRCNFVENSISNDGSTFLLRSGSTLVTESIFRGNSLSSGAKEFVSTGGRAEVVNCFFDAELASTTWMSRSGNEVDGNKPTIKMCHFNTLLCTARLPCDFTAGFTQSDELTMSSEFVPSERFTSSERFSSSVGFSETDGFNETEQFTETERFSQSDEMTESVQFSSSDSFSTHFFSPSDRFTLTNDFSNTYNFTQSDDFLESETFTLSLPETSEISDVDSFSEQPSPTNKPEGQKDSKPLSTGAIVGIVVGIVALIAIIVVVVVVVKKRKGQQQETSDSIETNTTTEMDTETTATGMDDNWQAVTQINPMFGDARDGVTEQIFDQNLE